MRRRTMLLEILLQGVGLLLIGAFIHALWRCDRPRAKAAAAAVRAVETALKHGRSEKVSRSTGR